MNKNFKILLAVILCAMIFTPDKICKHLGFGQAKHHGVSSTSKSVKSSTDDTSREGDYFVNDSLYRWDEQRFECVATTTVDANEFQAIFANISDDDSQSPIEIDWKVLMDIKYRLRYFKELDMEMYAPVFSKAVKKLDGKEVIVEGFVIPFEEETLSLSYNPYAACFFCGKASPASVISMYLKDESNRYKMDDFKKFKGTLHLNHDDPNEFYYILKDAVER